MQRRQHFAAVNYSEEREDRNWRNASYSTDAGKRKMGVKRRTTCKKLWSK
jgi:hypothetical protein